MGSSMTRRDFCGIAAAATLAANTRSLGATPASSRPPNVILLLGDDHRWDAMSCMGNKVIRTPNLDRLAQEGVMFENHFCTTPICCASRASIMLGQYAGTTGIYDFAKPLSPEQVEETYWKQMKTAGYHIGFVGKFGVGNKMPSQEFDYWEGFGGQGEYFPKGPKGPHLTYIMRDQALEFLHTLPAEKPFCLSISFKAPHVQDKAPEQYLPSEDTLALYNDVTVPPPEGAGQNDVDRFPIALHRSENRQRWAVRFATPELYQASMKGYYRLINGNDNVLGTIRKTLATMGLADNTIIIYSADHGIFNGEHGFAGKWLLQEESLRIPLIVYDPRVAQPARGKRVKEMSLNIDLAPTVLELAGLAVPSSKQGRSMAAVVRGESSPGRSVWFIEHHFPDGGWIPSSEGIRTRRWKYIHYTDVAAPFEELYDLEHDPHETNNLAGKASHAREQAILTNYWKTWAESLRNRTANWMEPITEKDLQRDGLS